jgi:hypothetical protein
VQEIESGAFKAELEELKHLPLAELQTRYNARQIED